MKVLVAVEDRVYGDAIVDFIKTQKWAAGTSFEIIHVIDREPSGEIISEVCCVRAEQLLEEEKKAAEELVLDLELKLLKAVPDANTDTRVIFGRAKEQILEEVDKTNADLLIVGSHGRRGFSRFLLGSVSMALLSQAPCSVLIVKLPQQEKGKTEAASAEPKTTTAPAQQVGV